MTCYHPIPAFQDTIGGGVTLHPPIADTNLQLPCGSCIGCRTSHATSWARRAQHEAASWAHNAFLTLTYNDENLPHDGGLRPKHLQGFLKRLRARHSRIHNPQGKRLRKKYRGMARHLISSPLGGLRYICSGEYGETFGRPHYHAILFNIGFLDLTQVGSDLYESALLNKLWPYGTHKIGTVTGASANYVAQYTLKNVGKVAVSDDGEILQAPYIRVSTVPPIGTKYLTKYKNDLKMGYLVADGAKERIPRAYMKILHNLDPHYAEQVAYKASQHRRAPENLEAAEIIHTARRRLHRVSAGGL
ncbi:MAG: replication initiator protein [Microvirus sp.]|nr:MAG: replication initiator protein [Microvirus sp.]